MSEKMELGIKLTADPSQLKAGLEDARGAILKTYADAKNGVGAAGDALRAAQQNAQAMAKSLSAAGVPTKQMVRDFEAAKKAVADAKAAVLQQTQAMQSVRAAARANADEIERASKAIEGFKASQATMAASAQIGADRDLLGISAHKNVEAQIDAVKAAYERLKASGKLTSQELAQAAMQTNARIRELEAGTNGWGESIAKAKFAIGSMVASGSGIAYVARASMNFEKSMAGVSKVVEGTEAQIGKLTDDLREMAQAMPVEGGLNGLAAIAAAGGQLGVPIEKLREFTELTAKMSSAFNMSADAAGQAVARMMNVYDLPLGRIRELGDAVNVLGNTMSTTEGEIVEVMTRIGGGARQFGLTAEQAAALAASFTALGKPAMVAGTAINALLSKLQTANIQGAEFQAALAKIGVSGEQLAEDIEKNPQAALTAFLQTLQKLDGRARSETLTQLFGLEYQDDLALLVGSLGQYEAALLRVADKRKTAGALDAEYAKQAETAAAKLQILKQSFETLAVALGDALMPVLKPLIKGLGSVTAAAAAFANEFPVITGIAEALMAGAIAAAGVKTAMLALRVVGVQSIAAITAQIAAMNIGLKASVAQVGLLRTAMHTLGGVITAALAGWEVGSSLREKFVEVEQMGIALAGGLTKVAERTRAMWNIITSPGSASEILAEMEKNLARIDDEYTELFAHAAKRREAPEQTKPDAAAPVEPKKLSETEQKAEALALSLKAAREAAKELGLDLSQFSSEVSPEFMEVEGLLDKLVASFDKLKDSGIDTGAALNDALGKALDKAKNPADLLALTERVAQLGEAGKLAKPKMLDLFNAIKDKAKDAGGEAKKLQAEIDALINQANSIRADGGSLSQRVRDAKNKQGKTPEQLEAEYLKQAKQATDDAAYYANAAKVAQMDGRSKEAAEYAKKAEASLKAANDAAGKLSEDALKSLDTDKLDDAEASILEQQAAAKQQQLAELQAATEAQQQQLTALETRIDELILKASTGATLNVDTGSAQPAVDAIKASIDAIPTEKTVTINVVENRTGGASGDQTPLPALAEGGAVPGYSPHPRADNLLARVTAGEYIQPVNRMREPGMFALMELLRRRGMAGFRSLIGYADGGGVAGRVLNAQPLPRPERAAVGGKMVPAVFNIPNVGRVPVNVSEGVAEDLARVLARENLMRGRR